MLDLITTANSEKTAEKLQFDKIAEGTLSRFENLVYKVEDGKQILDDKGQPVVDYDRFDKFRVNNTIERYARKKNYTFGFKREGDTVYFVIGNIKNGISFKKTSRQTLKSLAEVIDKAFPDNDTNRYILKLDKVEGEYIIYTVTPTEPFEFKKRERSPEQIEKLKASLAAYQAKQAKLKASIEVQPKETDNTSEVENSTDVSEEDYQNVNNNVNISSLEESI